MRSQVAWLYASYPRPGRREESLTVYEMDDLESAWRSSTQAGRATAAELQHLAVLHGVTCAKWMLFRPAADFDRIWPAIVPETCPSRSVRLHVGVSPP